MKWQKCIGEGTALGSIVLILFILLLTTYNGLTTGSYRILIDSNAFYENYLELVLVILGLYYYVKTRRIKFTLHPRGRKVAKQQ